MKEKNKGKVNKSAFYMKPLTISESFFVFVLSSFSSLWAPYFVRRKTFKRTDTKPLITALFLFNVVKKVKLN